MSQNQSKSSFAILQELMAKNIKNEISVESVRALEKEIERSLAIFDVEKRRKVAKAAEDLSKLVITR